MFEPTERDLEDILYDLRDASIFFRNRLDVYIPGYPEFKVGMGFGGYHWSFFQRGADCIACGNCCKRTFRRIWFWWESEKNRPRGLQPLDIRINGKWTRVWVWVNSGYEQCDFLQEQDELVEFDFRGEHKTQWKEYCVLHLHEPNLKPVHCHLHPLTGLYAHKGALLLSRRLPSRNFRWPECPISISEVPYTVKDYLDDRYSLEHLAMALEKIPGSWAWDAVRLWEKNAQLSLLNKERVGTILFEETLYDPNP